MKFLSRATLVVCLIATGCTANQTAGSSKPRPNYFTNRVTYTGSNIPQDPHQITEEPLFATAPSESVARDVPSLYPTDPIVGADAGPNDPGTRPNHNVGAGPAGSNPLPGRKSDTAPPAATPGS